MGREIRLYLSDEVRPHLEELIEAGLSKVKHAEHGIFTDFYKPRDELKEMRLAGEMVLDAIREQADELGTTCPICGN